jgi:hypothetical protein
MWMWWSCWCHNTSLQELAYTHNNLDIRTAVLVGLRGHDGEMWWSAKVMMIKRAQRRRRGSGLEAVKARIVGHDLVWQQRVTAAVAVKGNELVEAMLSKRVHLHCRSSSNNNNNRGINNGRRLLKAASTVVGYDNEVSRLYGV